MTNPKKKKPLTFKMTKKMEQLKKIRKEQEEKFKERIEREKNRDLQRKRKHEVVDFPGLIEGSYSSLQTEENAEEVAFE